MANPWFRMYSEFASDPKVQSMSEAMQRRLVMVFCLRCSNVLATLQEDELAFALHINVDELRETKALFEQKGFIDECWNVLKWDVRQFNSDSSTARSRKHRETKRALEKERNASQRCSNVAATPPDTDTDKEYSSPSLRSGDVDETEASPLLDAPPPAAADASARAAGDNCPHQQIIDAYHAELPMCPRIREWTSARAQALRSRWREKPERQNVDWWRRLFAYCAESDFLTGRAKPGNGRRPFEMTLDWLVKAENFAKVLEGRYENSSDQREAA